MFHFKLLVFDFDGVIVESNEIKEQAFYEVFKENTLEQKEKVKTYEARNAAKSRFVKFNELMSILGYPKDSSVEKKWLESYKRLTIDHVVNCPEVKGAIPLLKELRGRVPIYLLSNTPQDDLDQIIDKRNFRQYFDLIVGSPIEKSDELIKYQKDSNLEAREILFVGDSITDYEASVVSKVSFIGRNSGRAFPEGLNIVNDLEELLHLIKERV